MFIAIVLSMTLKGGFRLELEVRGEEVIHQIVEVASLNQPLALVAIQDSWPASTVFYLGLGSLSP